MSLDFDNFILNKHEPNKSTLFALTAIILNQDKDITKSWKYSMPFFCYKNKMFCYLWIDKKTQEPYIGFVEGNRINNALLEKGNRSRMKIFRVNPTKNIPIQTIKVLVKEALSFYKKGIIKT